MKKDKNDKMQSWMEEGQGKRKEGFHFVLLSKEENWLHHNTTKSIKNLPLCVSPLAFLSYTPQSKETMPGISLCVKVSVIFVEVICWKKILLVFRLDSSCGKRIQ